MFENKQKRKKDGVKSPQLHVISLSLLFLFASSLFCCFLFLCCHFDTSFYFSESFLSLIICFFYDLRCSNLFYSSVSEFVSFFFARSFYFLAIFSLSLLWAILYINISNSKKFLQKLFEKYIS